MRMIELANRAVSVRMCEKRCGGHSRAYGRTAVLRQTKLGWTEQFGHKHQQLHRPQAAAGSAVDTPPADIIIVGAGIIGLFCALRLLQLDQAVQVQVLDAAHLQGRATGAGQGYIWLAHRPPDSPAWDLAAASQQMWHTHVLQSPGLTPEHVEWQEMGSMLLATSEAQGADLAARQASLAAKGVRAELLDHGQLLHREPALQGSSVHSGLLVPADAQLNGQRAAEALLQCCQAHGSRFSLLAEQPCVGLLQSPSGSIQGVVTSSSRLHAGAVVIAAGAWSADLLARHAPDSGIDWQQAIRPRKGHLLQFSRPPDIAPLQHGLMEAEYSKHYQGPANVETDQVAGITFTATTAADGSLLIGSSRKFADFSSDPEQPVIESILERACTFIPKLGGLTETINPRVGLRPYCTANRPLMGPVPGCPGLFVAAGHEGSGLTLAPASADIMAAHVLGLQQTCVAAERFTPASVYSR